MTQPPPPQSPHAAPGKSVADNASDIRRVLHDMNNGLEIIIQASYLVGTLDIGADGKQWVKLLEQGVQQVTTLNAQLRDLVIKNQPQPEA